MSKNVVEKPIILEKIIEQELKPYIKRLMLRPFMLRAF